MWFHVWPCIMRVQSYKYMCAYTNMHTSHTCSQGNYHQSRGQEIFVEYMNKSN